MRRRHGLVVVPPDLLFAGGVAHHKFVGGGTAGMLAGEDNQSTVVGNMTFLARERPLQQFSGGQVGWELGDGKAPMSGPGGSKGRFVRGKPGVLTATRGLRGMPKPLQQIMLDA